MVHPITRLTTPLGPWMVGFDGDGVLNRVSVCPRTPPDDLPALDEDHPVARALAAYFAGDLTATDVLPVALSGTPFQVRTWQVLRTIPPGTTWTYAQLALAVGSVPRAVGAANGANRVAVVVPCHRVVGAGGALVGYAGGLEMKRRLLRHEGALLL
jgi:methylated-DNA-[protein]-cysteine S-methyltransferase